MLRKSIPSRIATFRPAFRPRFFALLLLPLLLLSCGKKGPPTLKSYDRPDKPSLLSAIHREDSIILTWDFPKSKEETISGFLLLKSSGAGFEKIHGSTPGNGHSGMLTLRTAGRTGIKSFRRALEGC